MLSRAHLLIENEIKKIKSTPPWGVHIEPVSDDSFFEWLAKISGLRDTIWEGGIFQIYIRFDEHFNVRPPEVYFQTIPFHPNVDMRTGRPCVDYLDNLDLWRPGFSLSMLLVSLQALLSNPNLNHAINNEAIQMMSQSPDTYRQMVVECVTASQRIEAGGSPQLEDTKVKFDPALKPYPPAPRTATVRRSNKLSFDDYHMTWRSIATSKPTENADNPLLEALQNKPSLQKVHMALPPEEVEEQMRNQMEEHKQLMFGRFQNKLTFSEEREAKLARLQRMKKIYLPPRHSPSPSASPLRSEGSRGSSFNAQTLAGPSLSPLRSEGSRGSSFNAQTLAGLSVSPLRSEGSRGSSFNAQTLAAPAPTEDIMLDPVAAGMDGREWEKEVDDLVSWSNNLDTATIDT